MTYTQADIDITRKQYTRRLIVLVSLGAALLMAVIAAFLYRSEVLTDALTILLGVVLIAGWDLFIRPLRCCIARMDGCVNGRRHEITGSFDHVDSSASLVDGVYCHALTIRVTNDKNKTYDQLYYCDAQKPLPDYAPGTPVRVTYHDRALVDIVAL